jgi:lipopolysaccharide exporter
MSSKGHAVRGVKFASASNLVGYILKATQLIVLARLVGPDDFGLFSMATVVIGIVSIASSMGTSDALIHRDNLQRNHVHSLLWFNVAMGVGLTALILTIAPLVAWLYREPRVEQPLMLYATVLAIGGVSNLFHALLERELRFARLALVEVSSVAVGTIVAITAALAEFGVLSFVLGVMVSAATRLVLLAISTWRSYRLPTHFAFSDLRPYLSYGTPYVGQRMINYVTGNVDLLVVGLFGGAQALGYYSMAQQVVTIASSKVNQVFARVFFPVFSRVKDSAETLRNGFLRMQELTALVNLPILAGLAVTAPLLVPTMMGANWAPSVVLLQVLALAGMLRSMAGTSGPLILVTGKTSLGFRWSVVIVMLQVPGVYIGMMAGSALGVALANLLLQLLYQPLNYYLLVQRMLGPCLRDYVRRVLPSVWMVLVMVAVVALVDRSLVSLGWGRDTDMVMRLALNIVSGVVVYAALAWFSYGAMLTDLVRLAVRGKST